MNVLRQRTFMRPGRRGRLALEVVLWCLVCMMLGLAALWWQGGRSTPIEFNETLIHKLEQDYETVPNASFMARVINRLSCGLNRVWHAPSSAPPDPADELAVMRYVFGWVPLSAIVYPTEGFYYFRFKDINGRDVWGNLRVAELDSGTMWLAYFQPGTHELKLRIFDHANGLAVKPVDDFAWHVTFEGKTVRFQLPRGDHDPAPANCLTAEEELVASELDESGVSFDLVFNTRLNAFYFLLDRSRGDTESYDQVGPNVSLGKRTGFVYHHDAELDRSILIGVFVRNAEANNYFDGPADQVPYWAHVRPYIYRAYPHMLDGSLDQHGVRLGQAQWRRIAISPYMLYLDPDECVWRSEQVAEHQDAGMRCAALTEPWLPLEGRSDWVTPGTAEIKKLPFPTVSG